MLDAPAASPLLDSCLEGCSHQPDRASRLESHLERPRPNPLATDALENLSGLLECRQTPCKSAQNDRPYEICGADGPQASDELRHAAVRLEHGRRQPPLESRH